LGEKEYRNPSHWSRKGIRAQLGRKQNRTKNIHPRKETTTYALL
jgi:hypothetical protein